MAKMCNCKRDFQLNNRACCSRCWNERRLEYDAGEFDAAQSSNAPEPHRQPQHTYTPAARPSQAEAADNA